MRSTMSTLISRVRLLVGDPDQAGRFYADDTIEAALDVERFDVRYYELTARETRVVGGFQWLNYWDTRYGGNWESDLELTTGGYTVVAADTSDTLTGHWTFVASRPPPLYITGKTFDVHAAAAELVEQRAASVMLDFDVTSDRQSVLRSQKHKMLLEQAKKLRQKARTRSIRAGRYDSDRRAAC